MYNAGELPYDAGGYAVSQSMASQITQVFPIPAVPEYLMKPLAILQKAQERFYLQHGMQTHEISHSYDDNKENCNSDYAHHKQSKYDNGQQNECQYLKSQIPHVQKRRSPPQWCAVARVDTAQTTTTTAYDCDSFNSFNDTDGHDQDNSNSSNSGSYASGKSLLPFQILQMARNGGTFALASNSILHVHYDSALFAMKY